MSGHENVTQGTKGAEVRAQAMSYMIYKIGKSCYFSLL